MLSSICALLSDFIIVDTHIEVRSSIRAALEEHWVPMYASTFGSFFEQDPASWTYFDPLPSSPPRSTSGERPLVVVATSSMPTSFPPLVLTLPARLDARADLWLTILPYSATQQSLSLLLFCPRQTLSVRRCVSLALSCSSLLQLRVLVNLQPSQGGIWISKVTLFRLSPLEIHVLWRPRSRPGPSASAPPFVRWSQLPILATQL